jgi:DNA polymerase III epsilon subunit-like protein
LKKAPPQKLVWEAFAKFVRKHNKKGTEKTAPIGIGKNSDNFDFPIANRLCRTYGMVDKEGRPNLFNNRLQLDIEKIIWLWFEDCDDLPNHRMDTLREYFGLSTEGAHDALVDVKQTAEIFKRFLKLHRKLKAMKTNEGEPWIKFKDSCKGF